MSTAGRSTYTYQFWVSEPGFLKKELVYDPAKATVVRCVPKEFLHGKYEPIRTDVFVFEERGWRLGFGEGVSAQTWEHSNVQPGLISGKNSHGGVIVDDNCPSKMVHSHPGTGRWWFRVFHANIKHLFEGWGMGTVVRGAIVGGESCS